MDRRLGKETNRGGGDEAVVELAVFGEGGAGCFGLAAQQVSVREVDKAAALVVAALGSAGALLDAV